MDVSISFALFIYRGDADARDASAQPSRCRAIVQQESPRMRMIRGCHRLPDVRFATPRGAFAAMSMSDASNAAPPFHDIGKLGFDMTCYADILT